MADPPAAVRPAGIGPARIGREHLATEDPDETAERRQERIEHEEIQRGVIAAQRTAVIELRDAARSTTRPCATIERELDLEELRMEA